MNAAHFFERSHGDRSLPQSSESFWTAVFSLFVLHLSARDEGVGSLSLWRPLPSGPPWYERKVSEVAFPPKARIAMNDLVIEPIEVSEVWPNLDISPTLAGISPDIIARFPVPPDNPFFLFVENKVTTIASLNANQIDTYPKLLEFLNANNVRCALWILQPVGCSQKLYTATERLESRLTSRFGLVLWEDVFRLMEATDFCLPGFDITRLQDYTTDAAVDCKDW